MKRIVLAVVALSVFASFAGSYKWTGAVSSDFADAGNWLVQSGDEWIETETPPANEYGVDDIVFEGDSATCANMPVLGQDYTLRRVFFKSGGWTLTVAEGFKLMLVHGNGGKWNGSGVNTYDEISILDTSGDGQTNTVAGTLQYIPACTFSASEGSVLKLDATVELDRGSYSGGQMLFGFYGTGTFHITGTDFYDTDAQSCTVDGPSIFMETQSGYALEGPIAFKGGRIVALKEGQITGNIAVSGDATLDLGNFGMQGGMAFGAPSWNSKSDGVAWTGGISNTANVRVSENGSIVLNPTARKVVFDGVLLGYSKWHGTNQYIDVGDIPDESEDLVFNGPIFNDRTGNNGVTAHFRGCTCDGATTYGSVSLNAATSFAGDYAKVYISTTVFVNDDPDAEGSSLGTPKIIEVKADHGVLRGDGLITPYTGGSKTVVCPTNDVFGVLAPGSIACPDGVLTIQRSSGNSKSFITTLLHTNSVFRIEPAANGACPKVVQNDGVFVLEQTEEDAEDGIVAPKIVIAGANAPARGRHRVLSVTGTLSGAFAPDVELTGFPHADSYSAKILYTTEGGVTHVDVRVDKPGLAIVVR